MLATSAQTKRQQFLMVNMRETYRIYGSCTAVPCPAVPGGSARSTWKLDVMSVNPSRLRGWGRVTISRNIDETERSSMEIYIYIYIYIQREREREREIGPRGRRLGLQFRNRRTRRAPLVRGKIGVAEVSAGVRWKA